MPLEQIIFFALAAITVTLAGFVVFTKNPVHSVLYLILTMFSIAGHYLLLDAQFLAIVHIIVYAGAIMVLFLFVLMLLNINKDNEPQKSFLVKGLGVIAGGLVFLTLVASTSKSLGMTSAPVTDPEMGLVKNLGQVLFSEFVVPFEISSILFIAAMVGAVMIGKRDEEHH